MNRNSYRTLFDLSGRVAVVTGGAGILGRAFCAGLADHGCNVAVVDIDEAQAGQLAYELRSTFGISAIGLGADISRPKDVYEMAQQVERDLGAINILHNNAATKGPDVGQFLAPLEEYDVETWRAVCAVNLDGMFLVAKEVGSRMADRRSGAIIQTASIYGAMAPDQRIYVGSEYLGQEINTPPVYSATKSAVIGLTRHLATYWADKGVRVNAISPGGVESGQNDTFKALYSARIPLGRMASRDEMVGTLIFLASDASSYITGQNIMVDGGLSAW